jgi:hypothetical protein
MATIQCKVEENGVRCTNTITLDEDITGLTGFICRHHLSRIAQVRANQREYDPTRDEADKAVRFQEHQFDPDLRRSAKPQGTSHVRGQGNEKRRTPENEGDPGRR